MDLGTLASGHAIEALLAIRDKRGVSPYQHGFYYTVVLGNRTGEIVAKVWLGLEEADVRAHYDGLAVGDVVEVRGKCQEYKGSLELAVEEALVPVPEESVVPAEFLARSERDVRALGRRLVSAARSIEDPHLRSLVLSFWEDPELQHQLLEMPAAKSHHHAWLGGFVEHLHGALRVAEVLAETYPQLDRDLLVTGVLLHDIGKVREYRVGAAIDFTAEGRLLGHIPIGDEMVREAIARIEGFPHELALKVRHLILSHHGKLEWGSAVEPRTPEAFVLHHLENLDAQVARFLGAAREHLDAGELEVWSPKLRQFLYLR